MSIHREHVMNLKALLNDLADRVAEDGTIVGAVALSALADATRHAAPGAAAALLDWEGTEVARVRAFSIVHGVALTQLSPSQQAWLFDAMRSPADMALAA